MIHSSSPLLFLSFLLIFNPPIKNTLKNTLPYPLTLLSSNFSAYSPTPPPTGQFGKSACQFFFA